MQTTLSTKGQIILPSEIRKKGRFNPGEKFEVLEKNGKIILSPVKRSRNTGLVALLRKCPHTLVIPPRDQTEYGRRPPKF